MNKRLPALAAPAALLGGLVWIAYAIVGFVRPLGLPATAWAGATALALLALALLGVAARLDVSGQGSARFGVAMAVMSLPAAAAAALGGLLQHAPLAANALVAGEVLLALGVMLVAIEAAGQPESAPTGAALFVIGAVGMLGLFAQALAAAAAWMLPIYTALVMAVYGLAWVRLGARLNASNAERRI
jgi:hypothetical protein